jgi:hypothetical protein
VNGCFGATWPPKTLPNQVTAALIASVPPRAGLSCPPGRQTTDTGVPCAAMPRALASASPSGKRESCSPCVSSVGAVILSMTVAGLACFMSARMAAVGSPVDADAW